MRMRMLSTAALVVGIAACGGGDADTDQSDAATPAGGAAPQAVANAATLRGKVAFAGAVPQPQRIDMSEEPTCAEKHSNGATTEEVIVSNGNLANVFIYVKDGLTGTHATSTERVVVDQDGCIYKPHVVGVQTGQQLVFKNSDGLLHNVKATPSTNRGFNISQPNNMESPRTFTEREIMIPIECNVHGWMQAYVGVVDHPYFAVSGEDGAFSIGNLPPGTYTIEAWHEKYGTQTQQVTLAADESKDITFNFNASQAGAHVPLGKPIDPHAHPAIALLSPHTAARH